MKKFPLDRDNFDQYINFLQDRFPGLTQTEIEHFAGIMPTRLSRLSRYGRRIRREEIDGLFRVYADLESGKITYKPDGRRKEIKYPDTIPFDKQNLQQLADFLQDRFPGLAKTDIERLAGMTRGRLKNLLISPSCRSIRSREIHGIFRAYNGLESGEMTYKPSFRCRRRKK